MLRTLLFTLFLFCLPAKANHDFRDPDGLCLTNSQIAQRWAEGRDQGISKEELAKAVVPSADVILNLPPLDRVLFAKNTKKGFELVFDQKVPADQIQDIFYEWCVTTLPKDTQ